MIFVVISLFALFVLAVNAGDRATATTTFTGPAPSGEGDKPSICSVVQDLLDRLGLSYADDGRKPPGDFRERVKSWESDGGLDSYLDDRGPDVRKAASATELTAERLLAHFFPDSTADAGGDCPSCREQSFFGQSGTLKLMLQGDHNRWVYLRCQPPQENDARAA